MGPYFLKVQENFINTVCKEKVKVKKCSMKYALECSPGSYVSSQMLFLLHLPLPYLLGLVTLYSSNFLRPQKFLKNLPVDLTFTKVVNFKSTEEFRQYLRLSQKT